jgi:tetratricopeptide (TPR) repeat protein
MSAPRLLFASVAAVISLQGAALHAQQPQLPAGPAGDAVKEARLLTGQGKLEEALAQYQKAMAASPAMYEAHAGAGATLDLMGKYVEARKHFTKAIDVASPEQKGGALRSMAVSYAFERDAKGAITYAKQAFDLEMATPDLIGAAEVANELARLCLESGDFDNALAWYKTGYETAMKQPALSDSAKALWAFRWHNAQARLQARKGNHKGALAHAAMAKAELDKGTNPGQAAFLPYLNGYVAFYASDWKTAIEELKKAQPGDPFVLSLLAQAYEKTGDTAAATELWRKIMTITMHNPTNAFARPEARKRVG